MIRASSHSLRFLTISLCSLYQYQLSFSRADEEISGQVVDAVFASFGVILGVDTERRKPFGEIICFGVAAEIANEVDRFLDRFEGVTEPEIENFVVVFDEIVVGIVDEVDEIVVELLSPSLLKLRSEASLTISFADFV